MSRQFDEYMEGKFEICGEQYELVEPENVEELIKAMQVRDEIQNMLSSLMHDEESSHWENLLQEQEDFINDYIEQIGEFDNGILSSNISYLTKRNGLRIGEVEKLLGVSVGYISRTTKEGSAKKLSIDVVWKIAKLFEVNVNTLISTDLRVPGTNTDLLIQFLIKLRKDTLEDKIRWTFEGGFEYDIQQRYLDMKFVSEQPEDDYNDEYSYRYYPYDHLNPDMKWFIGGELICCEKFSGDKDLVMIPLAHEKHEGVYGIDCFLVWKEQNEWKWQKVFYSNETPMSKLDDVAKAFYDEIMQTEFDDKITPDVKNIISNYLKGV
jgi:transcriptional regulator with XRE-family HTH domain